MENNNRRINKLLLIKIITNLLMQNNSILICSEIDNLILRRNVSEKAD